MNFVLALTVFALVASPLAAQQSLAERRARLQDKTAALPQDAQTALAAKGQEARSLTYNLNGQPVTRYFALEEVENGVLRLVETQTPGGKTLNASQLAERTGENSARLTQTGPQGNSAITDIEWLMSEMGFQLSSETTGPQGRTAATDSLYSRTESGVAGRTTATGPGGRTMNSQSLFEQTEDGWTGSSSATGPNGQTASSSSEYTRTEEGVDGTRTVIGPDSRTYTSDSSYWKSGETMNRSGTRTGPQGQQVTSMDTWAPTETGWTRTGTTTSPWAATSRNRTGTVDGNNVTVQGSSSRSGNAQQPAQRQQTQRSAPERGAQQSERSGGQSRSGGGRSRN